LAYARSGGIHRLRRDAVAEAVAHRVPALRDWAQAEDLLQTALVKVWRAWRRIGDDPDPYVYRTLVNTHASWWRRRWRGEIPTSAPPETAYVSDVMGAADSRALLWEALGRLPRGQRAVLVLRFFEDLSESRVAEILDCSVGTVKSQASKALAKLRVDPQIVTVTGEWRRN
jgi:RNA polymerase sigma-70 factor (sigma-E family)